MIFTTNKPLDAWGQVLHDKDLATAIVDCILERGRLLTLLLSNAHLLVRTDAGRVREAFRAPPFRSSGRQSSGAE